MTRAALTPLEPEQLWVPGLDCPGAEGAGEDEPGNESPLDLSCLSPLAETTVSRPRTALHS